MALADVGTLMGMGMVPLNADVRGVLKKFQMFNNISSMKYGSTWPCWCWGLPRWPGLLQKPARGSRTRKHTCHADQHKNTEGAGKVMGQPDRWAFLLGFLSHSYLKDALKCNLKRIVHKWLFLQDLNDGFFANLFAMSSQIIWVLCNSV